MDTQEGLIAGRGALARGRWEEARAHFGQVLARQESPAAAEGLSWAAWWLEDVPACLSARERAYRAYQQQGDRRGAARMALWLGDDHLEFHAAQAVADGWFRRATRLLDGLEATPEHGWLAVFRAHAALAEHRPQEAAVLAGQARDLGRRHGAVDLEMFSLATEGLALVDQGHVAEGMRHLDEATAAALGGEYENLAAAAWTCCRLLSACEMVRDYDRGAQWCRQVADFSRRLDLRFVTGVCRAHYAAILISRGGWQEAEQELVDAVATLRAYRPAWLPEAVVRLAELRRRQGRHDEAEELFAQAPGHSLAQLGQAELSLDRGDVATARDLLERLLRRVPPHSPVSRVAALEVLVRVALAQGDRTAAGSYLVELRESPVRGTAAPLRAAVSWCEGLVAAAHADLERACDHFEDAADLYRRAGMPVELGCARLELSQALLGLGRPDAAAREVAAARDSLRQVGARALAARATALLARASGTAPPSSGAAPPSGGAPPPPDGPPLTARQVQVLRLVADGLTDLEIAEQLILSPHTVHRHLANIYLRLECSSRATAVAHAARLRLL